MSATDAGDANCELCATAGGELVVDDAQWRLVLVDDADYPGFCRVIWQAHVRELTDLSKQERERLMDVVCTVETVLRRVMCPDKINLASLGNMTPHLHWHLIPRYVDDAHFPGPIWAARQQKSQQQAEADSRSVARRRQLLPTLRDELVRQFSSTKE